MSDLAEPPRAGPAVRVEDCGRAGRAGGLLARETSTSDRRYVALRVTEEGARVLKVARAATRARLAERLQALSGEELAAVTRAMGVLRETFRTPRLRRTESRREWDRHEGLETTIARSLPLVGVRREVNTRGEMMILQPIRLPAATAA